MKHTLYDKSLSFGLKGEEGGGGGETRKVQKIQVFFFFANAATATR